VMIAVALWVRLRVEESPVFQEVRKSQKVVKLPLRDAIANYPRSVLVGIGAHVCDTAAAYMYATFTVAYATDQLDVSRGVVLGAVVTYGLIVIALQPVFGALSDRIGRRPINLFSVIFTALWAFPFFALVQTGEPVLVWMALIVAACVGWQMTTQLMGGLRETSATVATQQTRLVASVNGVAASVDDAAQATTGASQSTTRARDAVIQATQTSTNLAATFDRLAYASQVTIFGMRPLEGLVEPFSANAEDFRGLTGSLTESADSLAANARDMRRVGDDLRGISGQLKTVGTQLKEIQAPGLLDQGLGTLELGSRLLLTLIFFESLLSALVGLALFILTGHRFARPHDGPPAVGVQGTERVEDPTL